MAFEEILFYIHYAFVLFYGIFLSVSFSGIDCSKKKNIFVSAGIFAFLGAGQLFSVFFLGEEITWKTYPVFVHLPLVLFLFFYYRRRFITAVSAVVAAYLCCQPAKWMGIFCEFLGAENAFCEILQIITLVISGAVVIKFLSPQISEIFQKDTKTVCIFIAIPLVYYFFDYFTGIYSDIWNSNNRVAAEFLPLMLCLSFLIFSAVYYKEYEQKSLAEQKEQIIRIVSEQQKKEIESLGITEQETRILRHDMRHLLSSVAVCIENGESEKAKELISSYIQKIDRTKQTRFCENQTIDFVLTDFAAKCDLFSVEFDHSVAFDKIECDEVVFASILSNALDNALNEQKKLLGSEREIRLMIKTAEGKLLLSVKNPVKYVPVFSDGLPVTEKAGHGFGCRSIKYMTEKLGGYCRFSIEEGYFVLRVII